MMELDRDHFVRGLQARIASTQNPRQLTMLNRMLAHAEAERDGDLDGLVATLSKDPQYHFHGASGEGGPKSLEGVTAYYRALVEGKGHILEYRLERLVVDDDCAVTEGVLTMVQPGAMLANTPLGAGKVDPGKHYLMRSRNVIFWAFDEDLMVQGEDSYSGGPYELRELSDDELPADYRALF